MKPVGDRVQGPFLRLLGPDRVRTEGSKESLNAPAVPAVAVAVQKELFKSVYRDQC